MKIVAFAPACSPLRGSEAGAGWLWARLVASLGETWVITRPRNREAIEAALPGLAERDQLHFVYAEVRGWPKAWRRGKGRSSIDYLLWQPVAAREARRLHEEIGFDLAWHLTFANAWLGSLAGRAGPPFVYGPVGGGVRNPWRLIAGHGLRGAAYEAVRSAGRTTGRYANPLARSAWSRARVILVQNPETRAWLPRRHRAKAVVCPNPILDERFAAQVAAGVAGSRPGEEAATGEKGVPSPDRGAGVALYAGRLVAWKGMFLALRALRDLPGWRLFVCGKGPDAKRLRGLADRFGVADRVTFMGFVPREELLRFMRQDADVMLFPSLHDEAGWVVVEAGACGLPVVCIDRGGPPVLGGRGVPVTTISETAGRLAREVARAVRSSRAGLPTAPLAGNRWTLSARVAELTGILKEAGLVPGPAESVA